MAQRKSFAIENSVNGHDKGTVATIVGQKEARAFLATVRDGLVRKGYETNVVKASAVSLTSPRGNAHSLVIKSL